MSSGVIIGFLGAILVAVYQAWTSSGGKTSKTQASTNVADLLKQKSSVALPVLTERKDISEREAHALWIRTRDFLAKNGGPDAVEKAAVLFHDRVMFGPEASE
ncbi:hypothetical protein [Bremerella cremea]|uniref:hypothetical protein n=1 Tax=Bremerella cremea TaxID=1031537 RepID=UPI0031E91A33